jgi:P27 family predicted phage terminase small subunit
VVGPLPARREAPEPPEWLSDEARAEWDSVVPELERLQILKPEDRACLVAYCETWATYVAALHQVRTEGLMLVNPTSGRAHKHPSAAVAETAATQLKALAAEFGLTPATEQRLSPTTPDPDDDNNPYAG